MFSANRPWDLKFLNLHLHALDYCISWLLSFSGTQYSQLRKREAYFDSVSVGAQFMVGWLQGRNGATEGEESCVPNDGPGMRSYTLLSHAYSDFPLWTWPHLPSENFLGGILDLNHNIEPLTLIQKFMSIYVQHWCNFSFHKRGI